jgi:hypothetical protein
MIESQKSKKAIIMTIIRARAASAEPEMAWNCFAFWLFMYLHNAR